MTLLKGKLLKHRLMYVPFIKMKIDKVFVNGAS